MPSVTPLLVPRTVNGGVADACWTSATPLVSMWRPMMPWKGPWIALEAGEEQSAPRDLRRAGVGRRCGGPKSRPWRKRSEPVHGDRPRDGADRVPGSVSDPTPASRTSLFARLFIPRRRSRSLHESKSPEPAGTCREKLISSADDLSSSPDDDRARDGDPSAGRSECPRGRTRFSGEHLRALDRAPRGVLRIRERIERKIPIISRPSAQSSSKRTQSVRSRIPADLRPSLRASCARARDRPSSRRSGNRISSQPVRPLVRLPDDVIDLVVRLHGLPPAKGTQPSCLGTPSRVPGDRSSRAATGAQGPEQRRPRRLHAAAEWLGRSVAVVPVDAGRRAMAEKPAADWEENLEVGT